MFLLFFEIISIMFPVLIFFTIVFTKLSVYVKTFFLTVLIFFVKFLPYNEPEIWSRVSRYFILLNRFQNAALGGHALPRTDLEVGRRVEERMRVFWYRASHCHFLKSQASLSGHLILALRTFMLYFNLDDYMSCVCVCVCISVLCIFVLNATKKRAEVDFLSSFIYFIDQKAFVEYFLCEDARCWQMMG